MNLGACYAVSKLAIESGVNGTGQTNNVYLFIYSIIYSLIYLSIYLFILLRSAVA